MKAHRLLIRALTPFTAATTYIFATQSPMFMIFSVKSRSSTRSMKFHKPRNCDFHTRDIEITNCGSRLKCIPTKQPPRYCFYNILLTVYFARQYVCEISVSIRVTKKFSCCIEHFKMLVSSYVRNAHHFSFLSCIGSR